MRQRRFRVLVGVMGVVGAVVIVGVTGSSFAGGAAPSPICLPATQSTSVTPLRAYPAQAIKHRLLRGQLPVSLSVSRLPTVLYARTPGREVIDPPTAERVLAAMWSRRERAGAQDNGPMLSVLEAALLVHGMSPKPIKTSTLEPAACTSFVRCSLPKSRCLPKHIPRLLPRPRVVHSVSS